MRVDLPQDPIPGHAPSSTGGEKIARAIARLAAEHDFASRRTALYA